MGRNVELKARVPDTRALQARAASLADGAPRELEQEDTFFHTPQGRLKLRRCAGADAELIWYERADAREPGESRYRIVRLVDPEPVAALFGRSLGVRGVVRKRRTLFQIGQTRVHLDRVEGLGDFAELEVVLREDQSTAYGVRVAEQLMTALGISQDWLLAPAYIDLLASRAGD